MRIFTILSLALLTAPLSLAQPSHDFTSLRKSLDDWAIEGTTQSHLLEGAVSKDASATHEVPVDPNRDTIIVGVCEEAVCTDVKVVGSDSTGAFVTPDLTVDSQAIVTIFADAIASKKLNIEVSTPGCKSATCAYAISVSSRPRSYPAE